MTVTRPVAHVHAPVERPARTAPGSGARPLPPRSPPYSLGRHLRACTVLLVLCILGLAVAYPVVLVEIGERIDPAAANGSLTYNPNGSVNGSSLLPPGNATVNTTVGDLGAPPALGAPSLRAMLSTSAAVGAPSTGGMLRTMGTTELAGPPAPRVR